MKDILPGPNKESIPCLEAGKPFSWWSAVDGTLFSHMKGQPD